MVNLALRVAFADTAEVKPDFVPVEFNDVSGCEDTVLIVGAGPAGLFAALKALELGIRPIVIERGKDVDSRRLDLASLNRTGTPIIVSAKAAQGRSQTGNCLPAARNAAM